VIELLLQAERALSMGLIDQAERLYRQAADADPRNSIAVVGLARVALERSDDVTAWREAKRALTIDAENAAAQRMVERLEEVWRYRGQPLPDEAGAGSAAELRIDPVPDEPEPVVGSPDAPPAAVHATPEPPSAAESEIVLAPARETAPEPEPAAFDPEPSAPQPAPVAPVFAAEAPVFAAEAPVVEPAPVAASEAWARITEEAGSAAAEDPDLAPAPPSVHSAPFRLREPDPASADPEQGLEQLADAPREPDETQDAVEADGGPAWPPADQDAPPTLPGLDRVRHLFGRKRE
jgi:hypothetical protein